MKCGVFASKPESPGRKDAMERNSRFEDQALEMMSRILQETDIILLLLTYVECE